MSNVRAHARIRRTLWSSLSPMVNPAFNTNQMQGTLARVRPPASSAIQMHATRLPSPNSATGPWSVNERRSALFVESVNGLRFAHLNSQSVGVLRTRRSSRPFGTVRVQRASYCERQPRSACFHSALVRRSLQAAFLPSATSVRFTHHLKR
jgi:hypothetical protein